MEDDELVRSSLLRSIERHASLASTNDHAKQVVVADELLPRLILADQQTAGRGRGENRWESTATDLTFSLLLNPASCGLPVDQWPSLSLTTAVALCDAITITTSLTARIKWPNDVFLNDHKVAGILLESPQADRLVIGVGVNMTGGPAPHLARLGATSLTAATGVEVPCPLLLQAFLDCFERRSQQLATRSPELLEAWKSLCWLTGKSITLRSGNRHAHGNCLGISTQGALLLETDAKQPEEFLTGSVTEIHSARSE